MAKKISYLARNFSDFQTELKKLTQKYYPNMLSDFQDASVGQWFIDLFSAVGDDLSFYIDRAFQETSLDSAQLASSIYNMARNAGLKIPGRKCAMCECEFSCEVPVNGSYNNEHNLQQPNYDYAPLIKRGTLVTNGSVKFELMEDLNFAEQFSVDGVSNRIILPKRNANGIIEKYILKKVAVVLAGESKIFRKVITNDDVVPFMSITMQDSNVLNIESIICKDGTNFKTDPNINDFYIQDEFVSASVNNKYGSDTYRFFEVESLADQYRFGDVTNSDGVPERESVEWVEQDGTTVISPLVYKGEWKPVKQKFITEFTDNGLMKITFGSGYQTSSLDEIEAEGYDTKYQISHMVNNDNLGVLPQVGQTMFILYRIGGGQESNVAKGAINSIIYSNVQINGDGTCNATDLQTIADVKNSIKVTNTTPSVGGKDMPTVEELKYLIKYNTSAQERCVTVKDYHARIMKIDPKYGCPFRVSVGEENNKIVVYVLYTDYQKHLTNAVPNVLIQNIEDYLSEYRMINDFVEIRTGKIINLSFDIDLFISKSYNSGEVVKNVINKVIDYMDISKHEMGEDIFIGDLEKEISSEDGVISLIHLSVFNEYGSKYSKNQTSQERVTSYSCGYDNEEGDADVMMQDRFEIDIENNDKLLFADMDSMFEIKYPSSDIRVRIKTR